MDIKLTKNEAELLLRAETEIAQKGHTEIKCPRCGGKITTTSAGTGFATGCEDCKIRLIGRGI